MRNRIFGRRTGLRASVLSLGTGNFGTSWGHGAEPAEARRIFERYVEAGGNFIDTADSYQSGESERLVGDFLSGRRDRFVLATKYTLGARSGGAAGPLGTGNARKAMTRSLEDSLRRLKTDYVDLYWTHIADGVTPTEEIVRAFDDLVRSGKILHFGLSNFPAWRVARADLFAELRGLAPLAGIQIEYNLAERTPDRELIPMAEALGLGVALWSPLAGGFLTGKYRQGEQGGRLQKLGAFVQTEQSEHNKTLLDTVLAVARECERSATEVAIAWLLAKAAKSPTTLIPVLGPRSLAQLEPTLTALDVVLSDEQVERLERVSAVSLGVPHEQIRNTFGTISRDVEPLRVPVA